MPTPTPPTDTLRLQLPGALAEASTDLAVEQVRVTRARRVTVGAARAGAADGGTLTLDAAGDEVVRVDLGDGLVLWTRADDLVREQGRRQAGRSGAAPVWSLDPAVAPARGGATGQRGGLGLAIKALEFFGVDVSGQSAAALGRLIEEKRLKGRAPGLYRVGMADGPLQFTPVPDGRQSLPVNQPVLVFLHGTLSSLEGSFKDLWLTEGDSPDKPPTPEALRAAREARAALRQVYGEHIYAFEHRTLTESPIANALALAMHLPPKLNLHLVSHSRGGLVGELLALAQRDRSGPDVIAQALAAGLFDSKRNAAPMLGLGALVGTPAEELKSGYDKDREDLAALLALLDTAKPAIGRFVRVACPARGTTLASGRLDRWLSVLGMIAGDGLAGDITDFLLKVVKERTDPRTLPGLEAMMPGSPLTRLLRWPGLRTAADLSAITGDLEADGTWGQLKQLAVDWFYDADHDLVVNTGSMAGGLQRPDKGARFRLARGPRVNHFSYFRNADSVAWLVSGLTRPDGGDGGFQPIALAPQDEPRARAAVRASRAGAADKPIAIVVPGTMGSALRVQGSAVWLAYGKLVLGGLGDIAIDAAGVEPVELLDDFYGPLLEFLAGSHVVHTVPYDWRLSVRDAAQRLTAKLEEVLPLAESRHLPVRIVAHSMGGLVARAMMADPAGARAWQRLVALPKSRLLMLGTPNAGSHEAVRWLTGFNPTQAKLSLLDLTRGVNGVIDIVRRFPGLAELLPFGHLAGEHDFSQPALWAALRDGMKAGFPLAQADALAPARTTWDLLSRHTVPTGQVVYVAGQQDATVVDYALVDDEVDFAALAKKLQFIATPDGDGTVTWASGRLPGLAMYLAPDTAHDDLCANTRDPQVFRGYAELLENGSTEQLRRLPSPAARGLRAGADDLDRRFLFVEPPPPDFAPDEAGTRALGFGARGARTVARAPVSRQLQITVRNGNLKFVTQPLLVGHYTASQLTGTEWVVDALIGGAMAASLKAGLYPGEPGTHQVFRNRKSDSLLARELPKPAAVIVAGLGDEGQLRQPALMQTVQQAVIAYAQHCLDNRPGSATQPITLAATLLGSGGVGIAAGTAAQAIALGVREANRRLEGLGWPQVDQLHFIELYLDRATEAWQGLQVLCSAEAQDFSLKPQVVAATGCMRRPADTGYRGAQYDVITALTVAELDNAACEGAPDAGDDEDETPTTDSPAGSAAASPPAPRRQAIAYTLDTKRARNEVHARQAQRGLLRSLVRTASNSATQDPGLGRALFKLLIPMEIEAFLGGGSDASASQANDLVICLDDGTAGIPWELLDTSSDDAPAGPPWAIRTRLLRRLNASSDPGVSAPREASADDPILIIGEPAVDPRHYGPLPGARHEAEQVLHQLTGPGGVDAHRVQALIAPASGPGASAREVVTALLSRHYRVLHIAGHGDPGADGGVVLEGRSRLGPREMQAMRRVPELVFLNCCHLAATAPGSLLQAPDYNRPRFAAGLARALIGMGVRCVVAAGWAVDDDPAALFASRFYEALLTGQRFIDAVGAARQATWRQYPGSNTWAAYQCYGDPDWRWRQQGGDAQAPALSPDDRLPTIVSAPGLTLQLENLLLQVRHGMQQADAARPLIDRLVERHGDTWGGAGAVAEAFGLAYAECLAWEPAVDWLTRAVQAEDGSASLQAAEKLANALARSARELADDDQRLARVQRAIALLHKLIALHPSVERRNLLGSSFKRLALIHADAGRDAEELQALADCEQAYADAERQALKIERPDFYYAAMNRAATALRLSLRDRRRQRPSFDDLRLAPSRTAVQRLVETSPELWSVAALSELRILSALSAGTLAAALPELLHDLGDLHARQPSPKDWGSLRDQGRFLLRPYQDVADAAEAQAARTLMAALESWCV